jgi:hypothetical protein
MVTADRTIAKMWTHAGGYDCYVRKRADQWLLTLEKAGTVLKESVVESPGEAIRKSEELLRILSAAG